MLETDKLKISISRGDTGVITITFTGDDAPDDTVKALFTVRKNIGDEEAVYEKEIAISEGKCVIGFSAEETEIAVGRYYWDIRLLYENGEVYTPMKPSEFRIVEVVGDPDG